jgi:hypothetical protein
VDTPRLRALKRLTLLFVAAWLIFVVVAVNLFLGSMQAKSRADFPFGVVTIGHEVYAQDFSYNLLILRGIEHRVVEHPYRFADQEKLIRGILPQMRKGMSHAYSPVTLVLGWPLLQLSGSAAFILYTGLMTGATLLLFSMYLVTRATCPAQLFALALSATSIVCAAAFLVGQSALLTTPLLGAFWMILQRPDKSALARDALLALLFWAICLKPSVAIIPGMLLLGAREWRVLALGALLLAATWLLTARYYGGLFTGLADYSNLLNHYSNADFPPYLRLREESASRLRWDAALFSIDRVLVLGSSLALLFLRWRGRIGASEHFQGMVWIFLLFSPYLMPSENWVLCLLVVEGTFFSSERVPYGKLLLLAAILNLRAEVTVPWQVDIYLKAALFVWILWEWIKEKTPSPVILSLSHARVAGPDTFRLENKLYRNGKPHLPSS